MAVVKNLMVRAGADFSGLKKETERAQKTLSDFKNNTSKTMNQIRNILITVGASIGVKEAVKSAMQVEASLQQVNRIMGTNSAEFKKWVNNQAIAYNMSKSEALKYGAVYGNLISGFTQDTGEATQYTEQLLKASSVVASATGRSMEDTMERIRSGLLGNTEAIEDLGVYAQVGMLETTEAFKKLANGKSWDQLDYQTQQQIRLMSILEQVSRKYGDSIFKNTNSAQQQFIAQLKNIQLNIGNAFLPIYQTVLPALSSMASSLASVTAVAAQFMQALFGKNLKEQKTAVVTTQGQAGAVSDLGDAYQKAGKQVKGALAGFDEINSLNDSSGGGTGAGAPALSTETTTTGQGSGSEDELEGIPAKVQAMADKVKAAFGQLANFISSNKEIIISAIAGIVTAFAAFQIISNWSKIVGALSTAFQILGGAIAGISLPVLGIAALIGLLIGNIIYLWQTNEDFRNSVMEVWNQLVSFITQVVTDIGTILQSIWDTYGATFIERLAGFMLSIQKIIMSLWESFLKPIFTNGLQMLSWLWDKHIKGVVQAVGEFLAKLINFALGVWDGFIAPVVNFLIDVFGPTFANIISFVIDILGTFIAGVADVAKGIFEVLGGIIDFIEGVFTGNWEKAWEGIKQIFKGIFDALVGIVKVPINSVIDIINAMLRSLQTGINMAIEAINDLIKKANKIPGINIPMIGTITIGTIPKLADGGITNGPMHAIIGDNPGGHEVVSPLDKLNDIIASTVGTAVLSAMQVAGNNSGSGELILQVDSTKLARIIMPAISKENARIGNKAILSPSSL